jgi:cytochrome d ubiquinol oxidase subunit I
VFSIRLPRLLSLLSYNQLAGEVQGINDLQSQYQSTYGPGNYVPPVAVIYWSFRIMVGAGFMMAALGLYALFMVMGEMFENRPKVLRLFLYAIALPYLANTFGWLMTELGRAPWAVFGLIKLEDAVSTTVTGASVLISLIGFTLIYGVLMVADIYLLTKYAKTGPATDKAISGIGDEQMPSLVGAQD